MANTTTISEQKGQFRITIPIYIVQAMRLKQGDLLDWSVTSSKAATITKMIKVTAIHKGSI